MATLDNVFQTDGLLSLNGDSIQIASNFDDFLGVNAHLDLGESEYANILQVMESLDYLGLDELRTGSIQSNMLARLDAVKLLADSGVEFDMLMRKEWYDNGKAYLEELAELYKDVFADNPDAIYAVEGLNEVGYPNFAFTGYKDATIEFQKSLYDVFQSDPDLDDIDVYSFSVWRSADADNFAGFPDSSAYAEYANAHTYFGSHQLPYYEFEARLGNVALTNSVDPVVVTELGYNTLDGNQWTAVSEEAQASMTLNLIFDAYAHGVEKVTLYELFDNNTLDTADSEMHFGLFHTDGSPKPVATAIHNLTTILTNDEAGGETVDVDPVGYGLTGGNDNTHSTVLYKFNGATDIVVWQEAVIWDKTTLSDIEADPVTVGVDLDGTYARVDVYDPLVGTDPIASYTNIASLQLELTDHPLIVEVNGTDYPGEEEAVAPQLVMTADEFMAAVVDLQKQVGDIQSIVLSDSPILNVVTRETMDALINDYPDLLGKISHDFQFRVVDGGSYYNFTKSSLYDETGRNPYSEVVNETSETVVYTGTSRADDFVLENSEEYAEGYRVTFQDFSEAGGDSIDVSRVLENYDPDTDDIHAFMRLQAVNASNTNIQIDADGGGDSFVTVATINHVGGLSDLDTLITKGAIKNAGLLDQLIVPSETVDDVASEEEPDPTTPPDAETEEPVVEPDPDDPPEDPAVEPETPEDPTTGDDGVVYGDDSTTTPPTDETPNEDPDGADEEPVPDPEPVEPPQDPVVEPESPEEPTDGEDTAVYGEDTPVEDSPSEGPDEPEEEPIDEPEPEDTPSEPEAETDSASDDDSFLGNIFGKLLDALGLGSGDDSGKGKSPDHSMKGGKSARKQQEEELSQETTSSILPLLESIDDADTYSDEDDEEDEDHVLAA